MLISELRRLIAQGEGPKLEFKRDAIRPEQMAREVVAFANMNGGQILVGVEDEGGISGVKRANFQTWLMDTVIGQHVHPSILPVYETVIAEDGCEVGVVSVPMGVAKPYVLKHKGREDIYVRYGNTCQLAKREQQVRLFDVGGMLSVDNMPIPGSRFDELDIRRLQEYFVNVTAIVTESEWQGFDQAAIIQWLMRRDLMRQLPNEEVVCIAAMALFGRKPFNRLPQSALRLIIFPGVDKDYDTILDHTLEFPFVGLGQSTRVNIEPSVPERVLSQLQGQLSEQRVEAMTRHRFWVYPEEVIRELVVNAFAHRDWTKNTDIEISVYADRMEVISPGALPNGMTIDKLKAGQRVPRNNNIVSILRDYGLMEHHGMGIRRKVIPLMQQHNGRAPDFEATDDYFKVTLWKKSTN